MRKHKVATRTVHAVGALRTGTKFKAATPRIPPRFWLERLDVDRGMWLKAHASEQSKDVETLVRRARALPQFLRVVTRDWKGADVVLGSDASIVRKDGQVFIRPAKGRKVLPTTESQVREVLEQARVRGPVERAERADRLQASQAEAARRIAEATRLNEVRTGGKVKGKRLSAKPVASMANTIAAVLAGAHGNTAMALALQKAAQHY